MEFDVVINEQGPRRSPSRSTYLVLKIFWQKERSFPPPFNISQYNLCMYETQFFLMQDSPFDYPIKRGRLKWSLISDVQCIGSQSPGNYYALISNIRLTHWNNWGGGNYSDWNVLSQLPISCASSFKEITMELVVEWWPSRRIRSFCESISTIRNWSSVYCSHHCQSRLFSFRNSRRIFE